MTVTAVFVAALIGSPVGAWLVVNRFRFRRYAISVLNTSAQADSIKVAVTTSVFNSGLVGDVDAILVHSRAAEEAFVANGFGLYRREIMYNDFAFVGPRDDPAKLDLAASAIDALKRIKSTGALFVSRGDDSDTHKKEKSLWAVAGVSPDALSGAWDLALFNQYAIIPVNPDQHPHVNADLTLQLEEWLSGAKAGALISKCRINGEALLTFNATQD